MSSRLRDRKAGYAKNAACGLSGPILALALTSRTRAGESFFASRNPNKITASYFLPRCGNLIDNQSGLNGWIVTCRQQTNVQVSGVNLPFGVFIGQSFDERHLG